MQKLKYYLAIVCFLNFFTTSLFSQTKSVDSLKLVLKNSKNDTDRCNQLNKLIKLTRETGDWKVYFDQLKKLCNSQYERASNETLKKFYLKKIHACIEIEAKETRLKGNYKEAIELQKKGIEIAKQLNLFEREANAYNSIGTYYHKLGEPFLAITWLEKSLAAYKKIKDTVGIVKLINNLGSMNRDFGSVTEAMGYFKESCVIGRRKKDTISYGAALSNLGVVLTEKGQLDSAKNCHLRAIELFTNTSYYYELAISLGNLAQYYSIKKDIKMLHSFQESALKYYLKSGDIEGIATAYCNLSLSYDDLGQKEKAMQCANTGMEMGRKIESRDLISRAAYQLAPLYLEKKDYKKAFEMELLYANLKDSLRNDETKNVLLKSHYKYEYGKKQETDSLNKLKELEISKIKFEKQENEKRYLYFIIALVFVLGALILNRLMVASKQKKQIEMANKDLERQHLLNQKIFSLISHDFRGPMLNLSLMLDKFKDKNKDEALSAHVKDVSSEVNNANGILNNLLNWARTEINIKSFEKNTSLVNEVFNEVAAEFKTRLEEKGLQLNDQIPHNSVINLPLDILRIALRNLISNAIKFSFEKSSIEIIFINNKLIVKDFGVGLPANKQQQLFKKEIETGLGTNNEEGFGMGLYIVSELLHKYNFKIEVESELGKGARFIISEK